MVDTAEKELVDRCLFGDREAQYKLYSQYAKAMLNVAYRMVNDRDEAQDILQVAFVKIFKQLHSFKFESTLGAWIKRIVVNTGLNHLKKKNRQLEIEKQLGEERVEYLSTEEDAEPPYSMEQIRSAIHSLPEGYRVVFSLYAVEGYDHSEIADIVGCTESNSKSQYLRAKRKLKDILSQYEIMPN